MSSDPGRLRCNRCWRQLADQGAWITACSHIFCDDDASKYFSRQSCCPCCGTNINRETDLKMVHPDQEDAPTMALWGQSPAVVFEACASALGFFIYQKKQEVAWMNHVMGQKEKQAHSDQVTAQQRIQEREDHIRTLNAKMASLHEELQLKDAAYAELKKVNKEKARVCKNYERLYNQMKSVKNNAQVSPRETFSPNGQMIGINDFRYTGSGNHIRKGSPMNNIMTQQSVPERPSFLAKEAQKRSFPRQQRSDAERPSAMTPLQALSRSIDTFTPKPLRTLNALRKRSPQAMRLTTPTATPLSLFQSRPSLYSRFKRRQ